MAVDAVKSVISQTYRPIEIILVDDGSTDDTPLVLEELRSKHTDIIKVIRQENGGPGVARETGRQAASGEFIQYLDSDDRLLPKKFALQVKALLDNPESGIAYGKTRLVDEDGKILRAPYKRSGEYLPYLMPGLLVDRWWSTHTPLYRRSLCDQVGSWPSNRMSEDWQYDARCAALKTRLEFCDEYVSEHVQHSSDRLTSGGITAEKVRDIGELIPVLYQSAIDAGVNKNAKEMQHFSRWAFLMARRLGSANLCEQAKICYEKSVKADASRGGGADHRMFRLLTKLLGIRKASWAAEAGFKILKRGPSQATQRQSWENHDHP